MITTRAEKEQRRALRLSNALVGGPYVVPTDELATR